MPNNEEKNITKCSQDLPHTCLDILPQVPPNIYLVHFKKNIFKIDHLHLFHLIHFQKYFQIRLNHLQFEVNEVLGVNTASNIFRAGA